MKEDIEKVILAHFGATPEQVRTKRSDCRNTADAKHFIWYFLCGVLGHNARAIAKEYNATDRSVHYAVQNISDAIRLQPQFAKHCREIMKELKELNLL